MLLVAIEPVLLSEINGSRAFAKNEPRAARVPLPGGRTRISDCEHESLREYLCQAMLPTG